MTVETEIELAVIRGADQALRRAAARSAVRAREAGDGALRTKHLRDATAWKACADDVAALKGPRELTKRGADGVEIPLEAAE